MVDGRMIALITLRTVFSWRTPVPFALVFFPVVVLQRNTINTYSVYSKHKQPQQTPGTDFTTTTVAGTRTARFCE